MSLQHNTTLLLLVKKNIIQEKSFNMNYNIMRIYGSSANIDILKNDCDGQVMFKMKPIDDLKQHDPIV